MVAGGHLDLKDGDLGQEMGGDRLKEIALAAHVDEEVGEDQGEYVKKMIYQKNLN